ncbi:hypothetical protein AJ79_08559 [Helicocarpus griseus UAMH5409]|uniref:DUF4246 domain-containing protein n=1 Tax=Helicocarpus griseus UAMH5409 TaxID=1447875 RepID=A0A2B7WRI3_9EURO|nr:hypothetical protein AJ79_08559 [Helicocarpus griseus UAMH5409]
MMRIMDAITDKPKWPSKVTEVGWTVWAHWFSEIENNEDLDVSKKMLANLDQEMLYKAEVFEETGFVSAYDGGIIKSDKAVPEPTRLALRSAAARLEDVSESEKDWHPGSDGQVLDLVHPSLFPLVYGLTRVVTDGELSIDEGLARCGDGETLPYLKRESGHRRSKHRNHSERRCNQYSHDFQWLPCEVKFRPTTEASNSKGSFRCEITSYINNLHPHDHRELYSVIEEIITWTIPLWNATLSSVDWRLAEESIRIKFEDVIYAIDIEKIPEELRPMQRHGETEDEFEDRKEEWEHALQVASIIKPEPGEFKPPKNCYHSENGGDDVPFAVDLQKRYAEQGIQVIVKLANIHLTPDKPQYPGGTWHIEGQLNERICATALYYYDSFNITESRLAFRQHFSGDDTYDIGYEQNHYEWLNVIFGVENQESTVQDVGAVNCKEGRLLTFPNIFQHRVQPFQLEDRTKPGHRKILALFLVDPGVRVLSTASVPVQRRDWWQRMWRTDGLMDKLPPELQLMVMERMTGGFPISMEEAKEIRERLMAERKVFIRENEVEWKRDVISLCEH